MSPRIGEMQQIGQQAQQQLHQQTFVAGIPNGQLSDAAGVSVNNAGSRFNGPMAGQSVPPVVAQPGPLQQARAQLDAINLSGIQDIADPSGFETFLHGLQFSRQLAPLVYPQVVPEQPILPNPHAFHQNEPPRPFERISLRDNAPAYQPGPRIDQP